MAGILTVLDKADGNPVNLGAPGEMTILQFADLMLEITGSRSAMSHVDPMVDDPKRREPDITRARGLGWEPRVPLRDGLERTVAWYRNRTKP